MLITSWYFIVDEPSTPHFQAGHYFILFFMTTLISLRNVCKLVSDILAKNVYETKGPGCWQVWHNESIGKARA